MIDSNEVMAALIAKLKAQPLINDPVNGMIYSHVPQDTNPPYIKAGIVSAETEPWTKDATTDMTFIFEVKVWGNLQGPKQVLEIGDAVINELENSSLATSNQSLSLSLEGFAIEDDTDGKTFSNTLTFKYIEVDLG